MTGRRSALGARSLLVVALVLSACSSQPERRPQNLALDHAGLVRQGRGDAAQVTNGRLTPEGTPAGEAAIQLDGVFSSVVVDLGGVHPLRALLLQAGTADVYFVEASVNGAEWRVVWRVPPLPGGGELRTRTTTLERPVSCRWLRVRPTTGRSPAVAAIQAFETEPRPWPDLDLSRPGARLPLWPAFTAQKVAAALAALAALFVLVVAWNQRRGDATAGRRHRLQAGLTPRRAALLGVAALALLCWPNFLNFHYYGYVHTWDVFHYYMGGKYLPELRYTRLYLCATAADLDDGVEVGGEIRDLHDDRIVSVQEQIPHAGECRARFTPARWRSFREDARFFRQAMGPVGWAGVRHDHGFNATPVWALTGGSLARLAPASWPQITALALVDLALVLAIVGVIVWGFGLEAGCVAAGYWGTNALSVFGWTGGSLLRYDWLLWLVLALAALRKGRPALAGFALGYSALLRVFPVFALAGLGLKVGVDVVHARSLLPLRAQARVAAGLAAAIVLLGGASILTSGGVEVWREFAANSSKHVHTFSFNLVGLPAWLSYHGETRHELLADPLLVDRDATWRLQLAAGQRQARPAQVVAVVFYLLLMGLAFATRRPPSWVAAVLGLGLVPLVGSLSCYYYSMFVALATLWPISPGFGLALAAFAWLSNVVMALGAASEACYAWLSLAVIALVTGVVLALVRSAPAKVGNDPPGPPPPSTA